MRLKGENGHKPGRDWRLMLRKDTRKVEEFTGFGIGYLRSDYHTLMVNAAIGVGGVHTDGRTPKTWIPCSLV
ncbi:hypothetical protein OK016_01710 [Vibrio chagasii]|nr:hypothetical protein [Vibrio chagasii]